jgi:ComF family protein
MHLRLVKFSLSINLTKNSRLINVLGKRIAAAAYSATKMKDFGLFSLWAGECTLCSARAADGALCHDCVRELPRFAFACVRCARRMPYADATCGRCIRKSAGIAFDATISALAYTFPTDVLIARAKYNGDLAIAQTLGALLSAAVAVQKIRGFDVILPIPLAPSRQAERGYNHAAEIARVIAQNLAIPLASDLMRTRETPKQADLPLKVRLENVKRAFSARSLERPLAGQHVLLVDDVMTTGATLNEAAKALKEAGAARVTVGVVARSVARTNL